MAGILYDDHMSETLLTVGNIYVDHNVFGVTSGETFRLESGKDYFGANGERVLGGSAVNAALQARRLGLEVGFVGQTGDDAGASEVRELLEAAGILSVLVGECASLVTSEPFNPIVE